MTRKKKDRRPRSEHYRKIVIARRKERREQLIADLMEYRLNGGTIYPKYVLLYCRDHGIFSGRVDILKTNRRWGVCRDGNVVGDYCFMQTVRMIVVKSARDIQVAQEICDNLNRKDRKQFGLPESFWQDVTR